MLLAVQPPPEKPLSDELPLEELQLDHDTHLINDSPIQRG